MTVKIEGRTRFADKATTQIVVRYFGEELLVIDGGMIESRNDGRFVISAKHATGTDIEGDAAYVAYLEGAGFNFQYMSARGFTANGVIMKAKFYDENPEGSDDMDFTPPKQKWRAEVYEFEVRFL